VSDRPPVKPGDKLAYGWALRRADGVVVVDTRCSDEQLGPQSA